MKEQKKIQAQKLQEFQQKKLEKLQKEREGYENLSAEAKARRDELEDKRRKKEASKSKFKAKVVK
eukprot:gene36437-47444_t